MTNDRTKEQEFHVKDNRSFNLDGTLKEEQKDVKAEEKVPPVQEESKKAPPRPKGHGFELNFLTFILSLASSVQISLGLVPHPGTNKPEVSLPAAKQTIDILEILEEKTKGNLSKEEDSMLKKILYELRMTYLEVQKATAGK